jgi:hypothetical protein
MVKGEGLKKKNNNRLRTSFERKALINTMFRTVQSSLFKSDQQFHPIPVKIFYS